MGSLGYIQIEIKFDILGVFLLNAVLTVEAKKSNSHKDCGWATFTDEVIQVINNQCQGVVFLLWGKPAQLKAKKVDRKKFKYYLINKKK